MTLNTPMLVVVGPMGRDLAAFAFPGDAWSYANRADDARDLLSFRRPDGAVRRLQDFAADAWPDFDAWATEGADDA